LEALRREVNSGRALLPETRQVARRINQDRREHGASAHQAACEQKAPSRACRGIEVTLDQGWTDLNRAEIDIVPNRDKSADTHTDPDFRIVTQGVEIGAGWIRRGDNSGNVGFNDR
jgi:hypothetical protein